MTAKKKIKCIHCGSAADKHRKNCKGQVQAIITETLPLCQGCGAKPFKKSLMKKGTTFSYFHQVGCPYASGPIKRRWIRAGLWKRPPRQPNTHCPNGHPYSQENVHGSYILGTKLHKCTICLRAAAKRNKKAILERKRERLRREAEFQ